MSVSGIIYDYPCKVALISYWFSFFGMQEVTDLGIPTIDRFL